MILPVDRECYFWGGCRREWGRRDEYLRCSLGQGRCLVSRRLDLGNGGFPFGNVKNLSGIPGKKGLEGLHGCIVALIWNSVDFSRTEDFHLTSCTCTCTNTKPSVLSNVIRSSQKRWSQEEKLRLNQSINQFHLRCTSAGLKMEFDRIHFVS